MMFSSRVPSQRGGSGPLVDYLAGRFTYYDRAGWSGLIDAGRVTVDGNKASVNGIVRGGQTVVYDAGDFEEPPADLHYSILYEDAWLFAVNKPGDLLIHRAGRSFRHNLMYQLRFVHQPPFPTAHSIHRLDRHTSGVVLIAKTPEIQAEISRQFSTRQVGKMYIAYVHGIPLRADWVIDKPIGKDPAAATGPKFRIDESGKEAVSRIERCEPLGNSYARLLIRPLTGRTHQLRVHLASIGHPIVGDKLYGSDKEFPADGLDESSGADTAHSPARHALHCMQISFFHPWLSREFRIEAPLPHDMVRLKEELP